jgi:hypothetical protein
MTCPFCSRPAEGGCRRPSCRVRREYAERQRPLFIEPLDPDVSELPEPTKSKDDRYHVVWSGALHRQGRVPGLSSFPSVPEPPEAAKPVGRGILPPPLSAPMRSETLDCPPGGTQRLKEGYARLTPPGIAQARAANEGF